MASSLHHHLAASIVDRSKTLINNDLKKILKEEGLSQTGNKAALQARVIARTSRPRPWCLHCAHANLHPHQSSTPP